MLPVQPSRVIAIHRREKKTAVTNHSKRSSPILVIRLGAPSSRYQPEVSLYRGVQIGQSIVRHPSRLISAGKQDRPYYFLADRFFLRIFVTRGTVGSSVRRGQRETVVGQSGGRLPAAVQASGFEGIRIPATSMLAAAGLSCT